MRRNDTSPTNDRDDQPAATDGRSIEKGDRPFGPSTSSTLDDRRPADRRTSYHTTAATAIIFSRSMLEVAAGRIRASHRRDDSMS